MLTFDAFKYCVRLLPEGFTRRSNGEGISVFEMDVNDWFANTKFGNSLAIQLSFLGEPFIDFSLLVVNIVGLDEFHPQTTINQAELPWKMPALNRQTVGFSAKDVTTTGVVLLLNP